MNKKLVGMLAGGLAALTSGAWAAEEIVIAVAAPMTGQYASFGEQFRRGAELAVADINAKGGVLGKQLKLLTGDDACDPKQAVAVANKLVNDGAVFVAGHFCSGSSIPASEVYKEENVLQISPGSTNPQLTERGYDNVFRTCGRDDQQGKVAAEFIAKHYPKAKVAILHDKTAYGKGLADETRKRLNELGVKEVMYEAYTAGEKDYSALVSKLKAAAADIIFVGGYHTEAGLIIRQAKEQGMKNARVMGGDSLMTSEYWSITGPAGEGTLMTFSPDPRKNPAAKTVVEEFKKQGFEPEGYTLYTYGTVQTFAQAADKAKSTKLDDLVKELKSAKFDTVLGKIGFDAKGDVTAPGYVVYEWKDGKYDYYAGK